MDQVLTASQSDCTVIFQKFLGDYEVQRKEITVPHNVSFFHEELLSETFVLADSTDKRWNATYVMSRVRYQLNRCQLDVARSEFPGDEESVRKVVRVPFHFLIHLESHLGAEVENFFQFYGLEPFDTIGVWAEKPDPGGDWSYHISFKRGWLGSLYIRPGGRDELQADFSVDHETLELLTMVWLRKD